MDLQHNQEISMGEDKSSNNFSLIGLSGDVAKPLAESAGRLSEQVYGDVAQGPLNRIGELVGNAIGILNLPFKYVVEKGEKLIADSLVKVPEEKRVPAPLALLGPVLEGSRYHDEDSLLREMFAQLLAKGFDVELQKTAHPAFAKILQHLAPDEAKLIRRIKRGATSLTGVITYKRPDDDDEMKGVRKSFMEMFWSKEEGWTDNSFLSNQEHKSLYRTHLIHLGLVETVLQREPVDIKVSSFVHINVEDTYGEGCREVSMVYDWRLTPFGDLFADACLPSEEEWTW